MKVRPVGAELFREDRWANGRTDMTKLIVAFRNLAESSTNKRNCEETEINARHILEKG